MHDCRRLTSHPLFSIYRLVTAWHHRVQYPICMSKPIKQWTKPRLVGLYRGLYYQGGIIINHYKDPYDTTSIIVERLNPPWDLAIWKCSSFSRALAANGDPPCQSHFFLPRRLPPTTTRWKTWKPPPMPGASGITFSNTNTPKITSTFQRNKWFEKSDPNLNRYPLVN